MQSKVHVCVQSTAPRVSFVQSKAPCRAKRMCVYRAQRPVCHSYRAKRHTELESARVSFVQSKAPCRAGKRPCVIRTEHSAMQSKVHVCVQSWKAPVCHSCRAQRHTE